GLVFALGTCLLVILVVADRIATVWVPYGVAQGVIALYAGLDTADSRTTDPDEVDFTGRLSGSGPQPRGYGEESGDDEHPVNSSAHLVYPPSWLERPRGVPPHRSF